MFGNDKQTKQQQLEARQTCAPNTFLRPTHFHSLALSSSLCRHNCTHFPVYIVLHNANQVKPNDHHRQLPVYDFTCDEEDVCIALLQTHEIYTKCCTEMVFPHRRLCVPISKRFQPLHDFLCPSFCHVKMMHTKTNTEIFSRHLFKALSIIKANVASSMCTEMQHVFVFFSLFI